MNPDGQPESKKESLRDEILQPLTDPLRRYLAKHPSQKAVLAILLLSAPVFILAFQTMDSWLPYFQVMARRLAERHIEADPIGQIVVIYPDYRMPTTFGRVGDEEFRGVNSGINRFSQKSGGIINHPLVIPFWKGESTGVRTVCELQDGGAHSYSIECLDKIAAALYVESEYTVFVVFSSPASRKVIPITDIDSIALEKPKPVIILVGSSNPPVSIPERNVYRYFVNPAEEAKRLAQYARETLNLDFVGIFFARGMEDEDAYASTGYDSFRKEFTRALGTQTVAFPVLVNGSNIGGAVNDFANLRSSFKRPGAYVVGHGPMLVDSVRILQERGFDDPILVSLLGAERSFNKSWPKPGNVLTVVPKSKEFDRRPLSLFANFAVQKAMTCARYRPSVDKFVECWTTTSELDEQIGVRHQTDGDITVDLDVVRVDTIVPRNE